MRRPLMQVSTLALCGCQPTFMETEDPLSRDSGAPSADDSSVPPQGGSSIFINEFMASNSSVRFDEEAEGYTPDWIELYNVLDVTVDLTGFSITDDLEDPERHTLSDLSIGPGGYLVLFADGDPEAGAKHLDFKLDVDGESIGLYDAEGTPIDRISYTDMVSDIVGARIPDGGELEISEDPTPGYANPTEGGQ